MDADERGLRKTEFQSAFICVHLRFPFLRIQF
ncbi:hypothetical protein BH10PLA1_BH10PLA1_03510 [soil metagenome]